MKINKEIWNKISDRAKREILCCIFIADVNASPGRDLNTIHGRVASLIVEGKSETEIATECDWTLNFVNTALNDIQNYVIK